MHNTLTTIIERATERIPDPRDDARSCWQFAPNEDTLVHVAPDTTVDDLMMGTTRAWIETTDEGVVDLEEVV